MAQLSMKHLVKVYSKRCVVNDVNLSVKSGEVVGLLGPNGAGKTTTFYMSVGMIKPTSGHVFIDETDITEMPMHIRARKGIGYLPQESSIFKKLSVLDNMLAILEIISKNNRVALEKSMGILEELGIDHLASQKASVLSGGERRRLEISRVLATDPAFILLDEPFAGVDPLAVIDIQKIIKHLTEKNIGVLVSDHNVRETLGVCNNAYILSDGKVIESGSPETIATSDIAKKIYLGNEFKL